MFSSLGETDVQRKTWCQPKRDEKKAIACEREASVTQRMIGRMNRWYDESMYRELNREYYGYSDYYNYGYWEENTPNQKSACENLMEHLLSFIPEKSGTILDVACGNGATTAYLLKYYPAENVFGINISEKQLETARKRAPGCTFLRMDAAQLDFDDSSFDNIICVEAAVHFNSRERFLSEAYRILKPGGRLVLSDILLTDWGKRHRLWWVAESNAQLGADEYEGLCRRSGFEHTEIVDATMDCWERHYKSVATYAEEKFLTREMDVKTYEAIAARIFRLIPHIGTYLLVAARKGKGSR